MSSLQQVFRGRVWKLGDSVDTNQLAPSGLAGQSIRQRMREHCLRGLRPDFNAGVKPGDLVVALGLPTFAVPGITAVISDGDEIEIDYPNRRVLAADGSTLAVLPGFPPSVEQVYEAGGLSAVLRQRLAERGFFAAEPA